MTIDLDLDELESEVRENITEPWSLDPEAILELIALARKANAFQANWRLQLDRTDTYERALREIEAGSRDARSRLIARKALEAAKA